MTEPVRVETGDEMTLTAAQEALLPRIGKGDIDALGEFLSLGLATKVTVLPAVDEAGGAATG